MMATRHYSFGTSGNPLVQALWMLVGGVLLVGAIVMGAVVLAVLLALGAVAVAVFAIRVWWLRRTLERSGAFDAAGRDAQAPPAQRLIEAEYTVVAERDARDAGDAREARATRDAGAARDRDDRRASQ
jgi:hypothetical protein